MTTAGLCGLLISGMDLEEDRQQLQPDGSALNCGVYSENVPVARALKWIGDRFPAQPATVEEAALKLSDGQLRVPFTTCPSRPYKIKAFNCGRPISLSRSTAWMSWPDMPWSNVAASTTP